MEKGIKRILCAIDFSDAASNAIDYAAQLSKQLNASLTLWNRCEISIMDDLASSINLPNGIGRRQDELSGILQDWCEEIKGEYNITCGYSIGSGFNNIEQTLAHYIDGENFDLIIAGTNGADDMYQFFFGTNTYRIMKKVKSPILIIPEGYNFQAIHSVLFATDYSTGDADLAKDLIKSFDADISFVHISDEDSISRKEVFRAFKNYFEEVLGCRYNIEYKRVINKHTLDALITLLADVKADILIISTLDRSWIEELFRKNFTKQVLETTWIPTLVFHQKSPEK